MKAPFIGDFVGLVVPLERTTTSSKISQQLWCQCSSSTMCWMRGFHPQRGDYAKFCYCSKFLFEVLRMLFWGIFSYFKFLFKDFPTNKPRWRKFAPGPLRLISAAGLQAAQRVQNAANQKRLRDRARAVAAPVRGNALPLPPPVEGDRDRKSVV